MAEAQMTEDGHAGSMTLVLGGTGKTGRRVADRLARAGHRIRIGSRSANPAFDWEDTATWDMALDGVNQVYVSYQPDLAVPGAVETVRRFFDLAVGKGVTKIVLLSGRGEIEAEQAEDALRALPVDWTILRASWFFQNFSESYFLEPILAGELALPVGPVAEPFVDAEDIADVGFAALTKAGHERKLYELTGPKALTFAEAVGHIANAANRDISFTPVSADDYASALVEQHVPDDAIALVLYLFTTVLDGRNTPIADGVQSALGRPAAEFQTFAARTAASGFWTPANV
jgi:uncharacterized protein YbjT (DUF2867 family)